ncbi:related to NOP6 - protein with possible role in rRNA processing [Melanopsichium pennsylvanicum]|uniref:Related to NOP6 - protein with possible role in rRNA processing n=2 Tax=Melanopsichium pennsylvanicum TaxID=63383 RepID=A0AAJ4XLT3_9BASI|nr:related to NOP6-protein with possible role in rRNA processing [Melanopsichium pennsylvanicum 4]SNX84116.1 related to NOP6 - protein with possible role in rRNA processing [Melanopsichium pennsylvanicum]
MAEAKFTKKQQKAASFKAGKKGSKSAAIQDHPATPDDIPEEAPVTPSVSEASTSSATANAAETSSRPVKAVKEEKRSAKRKRLAAEAEAAAGIVSEDTPVAATSKDNINEEKPQKRKKVETEAASAKKTTFGDNGEVAAEEAVNPEIAAPSTTTAKGNKFILFIGNMAFTTTSETITKHFSQTCGETPSVRLLTRKTDDNALANLPASKRKSIAKGKAQDPTKPQSKGCAFVEFRSSEALRKALKFHHTMLEGRKINVELTAGGGGKSETRTERIKTKNAGLEKERQKLHGKYVAPKNEARKNKRYEGMAGEGEERPQKRSRRDETEEGEESRGGKWARNRGKERKMPRFMATGSNAVRIAPTS